MSIIQLVTILAPTIQIDIWLMNPEQETVVETIANQDDHESITPGGADNHWSMVTPGITTGEWPSVR